MERANGFNVGGDAHIDPQPYATTLYVEWNKVKYSPIQWGTGVNPPGRGDVGIAPYIPAELPAIQPGMLKPSGCGRLGSRPYGGVPFIGVRG